MDLLIEEPNVRVVPLSEDATAMLRQIVDGAPDMFELHSSGMQADNDDNIIGAYLNCGGEHYHATTKGEFGVSYTTIEYRDAIKLRLDLVDVDDIAITTLRGMMWYGLQVDPSSTRRCLLLDAICHVQGLR